MSGTASPAPTPAATAASAAVPSPIAVSAADAHAEAMACGQRLSSIITSKIVNAGAAGTCRWEHATAIGMSQVRRAALAWIVADAVMSSRAGTAPAGSQWRDAALAGTKVGAEQRAGVAAFVEDVFGLPGEPEKHLDHLVGHVGEWLWYLHATELVAPGRDVLHLDAPKFTVVDSGGDGFAVYRSSSSGETFYRLWEIKKQTGSGSPSDATGTAYTQLATNGARYLARLTKPLSMEGGEVGDIANELVDLWISGSDRAGVGVSVASDKIPAPRQCFTTMGTRFPQFTTAGQLEGLLVTVEDFLEVAITVREYLWTVL